MAPKPSMIPHSTQVWEERRRARSLLLPLIPASVSAVYCHWHPMCLPPTWAPDTAAGARDVRGAQPVEPLLPRRRLGLPGCVRPLPGRVPRLIPCGSHTCLPCPLASAPGMYPASGGSATMVISFSCLGSAPTSSSGTSPCSRSRLNASKVSGNTAVRRADGCHCVSSRVQTLLSHWPWV